MFGINLKKLIEELEKFFTNININLLIIVKSVITIKNLMLNKISKYYVSKIFIFQKEKLFPLRQPGSLTG